MKAYGWTADYVRKELVGAHGWVYFNWAIENESSVFGSGIERKGLGYVGQERVKIYGKRR